MFKSDKRDLDDDNDRRSLFEWLVESIILFALGCFVLRLGILWILSVKVPLIVISVIVGAIVIIFRICSWKGRHHDY